MMERRPARLSRRDVTLVVALTIAFAASAGMAFASWQIQGDGIYLALVEAGLSWCF